MHLFSILINFSSNNSIYFSIIIIMFTNIDISLSLLNLVVSNFETTGIKITFYCIYIYSVYS